MKSEKHVLQQTYQQNLLIVTLFLILFVANGCAVPSTTLTEQRAETTLALPPTSHIGVNYYHESMGYVGRTDASIASDLQQIQQVTQKIKVYHNPYTNAGGIPAAASLQIIKHIVQEAKRHGMYVVWVENYDSSDRLRDATWSDYAKKVVADAAQAFSVKADEFLVGNELSLHNNGDLGFNDSNLPMHIKQLVQDCRTNFPGSIGYEEGWWKSESWKSATLGPIHTLYFTLYEPWHTFKSSLDRIAYSFDRYADGRHAEIGEVGTMTTKSQLHDTEQDWTRDLMRRYDYARQKGLTTWLFTFREPTNDSLGLFQAHPSTQPHAIWTYVRSHKTLSYHTFLSSEFSNGISQVFATQGSVSGNRLLMDEFNAQAIAAVPAPDYIFRGVASPILASGSEAWRAMRLIVRYKDTNNYYFVSVLPNANKVQLFRRQGGIETLLGEASTGIDLGSEYDFEIRINGRGPATQITVLWNTMHMINVHDTKNSTVNAGEVGMKNNGVTAALSDILVTDFEQYS